MLSWQVALLVNLLGLAMKLTGLKPMDSVKELRRCSGMHLSAYQAFPITSHLSSIATSHFLTKLFLIRAVRVELEPVSKVLLDGLYDKDCILFRLRGCQHVMKVILEWNSGKIQFATFFQISNEGYLGGGGEGEGEGCCQAGEEY